ncbi:MAG: hypothetical protein ABSD70_19875 [Terracidiphilus sp.]
MSNSESEALQAYVSDLIAATKSGKVNWKPVNPTTFVWETGAPRNARVILQRVDRVMQVPVPGTQIVAGRAQPRFVQQNQTSFVFQAFDGVLPTPALNLDSANDPELTKHLTDLFETVKTGISEKTLEFLRSILPSEGQ